MKIAAILSWYDETPATLARAVGSAVASGCSAVVALDGRFRDYLGPGGPISPARQYRAITEAAGGAELVIRGRRGPWRDEPTKRTALFRLAEEITTPDDWLLVIDADDEVHADPLELRARLEATDEDAAELQAIDSGGAEPIRLRALYRAYRGITVGPNHYTYALPDGRFLFRAKASECVPVADLSDVIRRTHWTSDRDARRRADQTAYYRRRDTLGVEETTCARCGTRPMACLMLDNIRAEGDGKVSGEYAEVCVYCFPWYARRNGLIAQRLGFDVVWAVKPRNRVEGFAELVRAAQAEPILGREVSSPPAP